ncbi:MAG: hypothetical protein ACLQVF_18720 [Isosphaeraceae bacterium]
MRSFTAAWVVLGVAMMTGAPAQAGEQEYCPPPEGHFLDRFHPVGGWNPGGGLFHWWDSHCFPRCCCPNTYCRKPIPRLCWPHYPPYYIWAAPEICPPPSDIYGGGNKPH